MSALEVLAELLTVPVSATAVLADDGSEEAASGIVKMLAEALRETEIAEARQMRLERQRKMIYFAMRCQRCLRPYGRFRLAWKDALEVKRLCVFSDCTCTF